MNKNIFIVSVLVVFGLGALMVWGKENQPVHPQTSATVNQNSIGFLSASETTYDFGTITMAKGLVEHTFTITNTTNENQTIQTLQTSCMCTRAYFKGEQDEKGPFGMPGMGHVPSLNEVLKPGESRAIRVVYDPNAHGPAGVGTIERYVSLISPSSQTLQLQIKAVVTP